MKKLLAAAAATTALVGGAITAAPSLFAQGAPEVPGAPDPERVEGSETFLDHLNPDSLEIITDAVVEPIVADAAPGTRYQFERNGYFYLDEEAGGGTRPVWNRIITLRDTWSQQTTERGDPATTTRRVDRVLKPGEVAHTPNPLSGLDEAGEARAHGLVQEFTLPLESAAVLAGSPELEAWFRRAVGTSGAAAVPPVALAKWLVQELRPLLSEKGADGNHDIPVAPEHFRALVFLHYDGTLSSRLAREVLSEMLASGDHPTDIVGRLGLEQISDEDALSAVPGARVAFSARPHPTRPSGSYLPPPASTGVRESESSRSRAMLRTRPRPDAGTASERSAGLSLLEVTFALAIISALTLSVAQLVVPIARQSRLSREASVATAEASRLLESIQTLPFRDVIRTYPDGTVTPISALPDGRLRTYYDDPAADPLMIHVELTWASEEHGTISRTFHTARTE